MVQFGNDIKLSHPGATLVTRSCTGWRASSYVAYTHTHTKHTACYWNWSSEHSGCPKKGSENVFGGIEVCSCKSIARVFVFWQQYGGYRVAVRDVCDETAASKTIIETPSSFLSGVGGGWYGRSGVHGPVDGPVGIGSSWEGGCFVMGAH